MSEEEFNIIFSRRLTYYLNEYQMTQTDLAKRLSVSTASVSDWINGKKSPRMSKIDAMCNIFNCKRSDLMYEKNNESYYEEKTASIAQEIFENKELALLFDAAKDADPEDLKAVHMMLLALKRKERNDEN